MIAPRVLPRGLQASEHRSLLAAGDAIAAVAAVVVALWLWSIPAGGQFSAGFVSAHAWWFLAAAFWMVAAAIPAAPPSIAFSLRRTLASLARGAAILLIAYGAWHFFAPPGPNVRPTVSLKAHYDGKTIRLDEPFDLPPNTRLMVTVLSPMMDTDREDWSNLSGESPRSASTSRLQHPGSP